MRYNLAALVRRRKAIRRKEIVLRPIVPPAMLASDLFASAYSPIIRGLNAYIPTIMAEYERSLSELTNDGPNELESSLSALDVYLTRLVINIRPDIERWVLRVEKWQRGKWRGAILSATGIDIDTLVGPHDARITIGTAIRRNVDLVSAVSSEAKGRISEAVFRGLNNRLPARDVAKEIANGVGMSRKRGLRIASNELVNIASTLDQERAMEAGLELYEWMHSGAAHPRLNHVARNGKRYKYGEPIGSTPGAEINCKCTSRAVLTLDGEF